LADHRTRWAFGVLGLAVLCVLGGIGTLLLRSGYARALNAVVQDREVRREKHPGRDDAHFVTLRMPEGGVQVLCVGRDLWEASPPETALAKTAWSRKLLAGSSEQLLPVLPTEASGALPACLTTGLFAALLFFRHLLRR
jgi:hypothetical protein